MGGAEIEGQDEEQVQETEQKSELERAQDQYGNAALASMLGQATSSAPNDGAGGPSLAARDREEEVEGPTHGGEDDPVDDGVLTMEDLTRSWNPRIKRQKERPAFTESMPDDDLPAADPDWMRSVRAAPRPQLPPSTTPDGLLQPTADAVRAGLTPWIREAAGWAGADPATRMLSEVLAPTAPALQDPWGRVLLARARAGAAASWMLLDRTDALRTPDSSALAETAFLQLCLEIAGSRRRVAEVERWAEEHGGDLPTAQDILIAHVPDADRPERWRQIAPQPVPEPLHQRIAGALSALADLGPAKSHLPSLSPLPAPPPPEEDPLGLDALLAEKTGGAPDPEDGLFHASAQSAERLAATAARSRVRLAAVAAALGDACRHWSTGFPTAALVHAMNRLDGHITKQLRLLVEVARATQKRSVPLRGLRNGLTHAARGIDQAVHQAIEELVGVAGAVLPPAPAELQFTPPPRAPDLLDEALRDGDLARAASWLHAQPPSASNHAAQVLHRIADGAPPAELIAPLKGAAARARQDRREALGMALETCLGACLLWTRSLDEALALSTAHLQAGRARRNAMVVASAALLGMEAHRLTGDLEALHALRLEAGVLCWHMGGRGALSLLERWTPPDEADPLPRA